MSQQSLRQTARRKTREIATRRRLERLDRERRVIDLAEQVMVALGERDAAVTSADMRAGHAIRRMTDGEGLGLREVVDWCAGVLDVREATRLRRLITVSGPDDGPTASDRSASPTEVGRDRLTKPSGNDSAPEAKP